MTSIKEKPKLLTADDLIRMGGDGARGELIRGVFHEIMSSGEEHGEIVFNIGILIGAFVKPRRLGRLVGSDVGVILERDPDTVREPDVAFISAEKRPLGVRNTGYIYVIPDLVAEVASPNDRASELIERARMWLRFGVRLVWMVYPETRTVDAHRPDMPVATLTERDTLDGGDVLPGFCCAVRDIFDL